MQLTAMLDSVDRHDARERIARVADTVVGAQGLSAGIKSHMKDLFEAAGMQDPSALGPEDFLKAFPGGI